MLYDCIMRILAALFSLGTLFLLMKCCNSDAKWEKNPICMTIIFIFILLLYRMIFL